MYTSQVEMSYMLAFGGRVGEPVGFDDGPNDDDRQRNSQRQQEENERLNNDVNTIVNGFRLQMYKNGSHSIERME